MEFIQRKTADRAVNHFLLKAANQEIALTWDRFEGQLPECGFCESGLSCRDCLQGPCISHPFKDQSKLGICGKDRGLLAAQSLSRLVLKGTISYLDQLNDFVHGVRAGVVDPADSEWTDQTLKMIADLQHSGNSDVVNEFPEELVESWKTAGVFPRGIASDVFKAFQRLEGGIDSPEEILLWSFKTALLGCMAERLQHQLKEAVFGRPRASELEVNLGVLNQNAPIVVIYGPVSPVLKKKIAAEAEEKNVRVMGVCTDPLLPPYQFPPVTTYVSQEIPLMTGAVDLIVTANQFVNPSLAELSKCWKVTVVTTDGLAQNLDPDTFAQNVIAQTLNSHETRQNIARDIPMVKEVALTGYSAAELDINKIVAALQSGQVKGIALLSGSNNVKYTQDEELVTIAKQFLANNVLCISEGEASVSLAKYRLLEPKLRDEDCGAGVEELLASLGARVPSVIDWPVTDFLLTLSRAGCNRLSDYPICAYFPEANRAAEVTKAMWTVAMGISTYFWPCLPVTGSTEMQRVFNGVCQQTFGAKLHVVPQKIDARTKAGLFLQTIEKPAELSGKTWG